MRNLKCKPRTYLVACFIATNLLLKVLVSQDPCFFELQYIGKLFKNTMKPVQEWRVIKSPAWSLSYFVQVDHPVPWHHLTGSNYHQHDNPPPLMRAYHSSNVLGSCTKNKGLQVLLSTTTVHPGLALSSHGLLKNPRSTNQTVLHQKAYRKIYLDETIQKTVAVRV